MSADHTPAVSVLLAVHNDARFLPATLDSILGQTFDDFELVTIDDASTDATPQILQSAGDPRIRYFRNDQNAGLVRSLNRGLALCRGRLIARIDGDDLCERERFAAQVAYLAEHPDLAGCATWTTEIDEHDQVIGALEPCEDPDHVRWSLCHTNRLYHPSIMLRRDVLAEAGGYDAAYPATEDYELWTRLIAGGERFAVVPRRLIRYRRRPGSVSAIHRDRQRTVGHQIATRYVSQLLGRPCDEQTVALMRQMMSWERVDAATSAQQVKAALKLMADVRRQALGRAGDAARAAADAEVAERLVQQGRLLLRDAPRLSVALGMYVMRLPRHRSAGLNVALAGARCMSGRFRRGAS